MAQPKQAMRRIPRPGSNSSGSSSSSMKPPTQVYTKGTHGSVKTRPVQPPMSPRQSFQRVRSRSQSRSSSQHRQEKETISHSRGRSVSPRRFFVKSSSVPPLSDGSRSLHLNPDSSFEDRSAGSAPQSREASKITSSEKQVISPFSLQEAHKRHIRATRRIVEELNRAQGYERRIAAITNACETFDHADESMHNIELSYGAAQALTRVLGHATNDDVIRIVCAALEMVFRGNPKSIQTAYDRIGSSLPAQLLKHLDRCEKGTMKNASISILNISRVLYYLSRCPQLHAPLCRQSGLLPALTRLSRRNQNNAEFQLTRIRIISNLASCDENKVVMYEEEGLFDSVLRTAHSDEVDHARHYAAVTLMDFAMAPGNQRSMAGNDTLLATLVKMILIEKNARTRESVITAIQNLAFAKENRVRLVSFKDGVVLEALKKSLASDEDPKARRRAAGALTNLACAETAEMIGNAKGLLDTLAIVATKDVNEEVQMRAAMALTKIANGITIKMKCHEVLLDALVVASLSEASSTSVSAVLRVKAREPENRVSLARHTGILDTLSDICMSDRSAVNERDNAVRAIMHLVNEDKNRKIMCNKTILDALVASANYKDPDLADARDSAIRALERLATEHSNRPVMARHKGLLVAVSRAVEREAEWEEQGTRSEHGYLAKPLLMSLLVVM